MSVATTHLFFVAHQDDELLTFGGTIVELLLEQQTVYVACLSKGEKSMARGLLGNGQTCPWHHGAHNKNMDEEEFSHLRDKEFYDSCLALGVASERILMPTKRLTDGMATPWDAYQIMDDLFMRTQGAILHTHTPLGGSSQHRDHQALGVAGLMLRLQHGCDTRFYLDPYLMDGSEDTVLGESVICSDVTDEAMRSRLARAAASYRRWDPEASRFAIGYHSVPDYYAKLDSRAAFWRHEVDIDRLPDAFEMWYQKATTAQRAVDNLQNDASLRQLEGENAQLRNEMDALMNSRSYRFGRALTSPWRMLRNLVAR